MTTKEKTVNKESFGARIDAKVAGKARGAAKALDMTISELVELALKRFVKEMEASENRRFKAAGPRPMTRKAA